MKKPAIITFVAVLLTAVVCAQFERRRRNRGGWGPDGEMPKTAREARPGDTDLPTWTNSPAHKKDVFTFCRVIYDGGGWGRRGSGWATDLMEGRDYETGGGGCADINFPWRLQQMTSMRTDPDSRLLRVTDPELFNYPFIYIVEPGGLSFSEEEAKALREYLLNGGFLMMDDFWGDAIENVTAQLKLVFPDREPVELPLDHQIYSCVFKITSKGQVPNYRTGERSQYDGVTWEDHWGDTQTVHHLGISDDKGRLMVIACHNTDNGDGWERESFSDYYFHNFSEKIAYPLGVNIVFYAMTH